MEYKRKWRQVEKNRKRCNAFIAEYTKIKFGNVYHEALSFYKALREMYPNKMDLKKTKEYQSWQKSLENQEPFIIVQHLYTDVTHGENESKANSDTESENENSDTESQNKNDENEPKASSDTESENENSDTESENSDTERQNSHTGSQKTDQNPCRDNMVLEIPLENYLPTTNAEIPAPPPPPFYDYEVFTDQRLQEIVEELRDDPELRNIFDQPENDNEEDEGVELPTLEEEVILDFEPFDYRLEVELADW